MNSAYDETVRAAWDVMFLFITNTVEAGYDARRQADELATYDMRSTPTPKHHSNEDSTQLNGMQKQHLDNNRSGDERRMTLTVSEPGYDRLSSIQSDLTMTSESGFDLNRKGSVATGNTILTVDRYHQ